MLLSSYPFHQIVGVVCDSSDAGSGDFFWLVMAEWC